MVKKRIVKKARYGGLESDEELLDDVHAESARERKLRSLLVPVGSLASKSSSSRRRKSPSRK